MSEFYANNDTPSSEEGSPVWRRVRVIPFNPSLENSNPESLQEESPLQEETSTNGEFFIQVTRHHYVDDGQEQIDDRYKEKYCFYPNTGPKNLVGFSPLAPNETLTINIMVVATSNVLYLTKTIDPTDDIYLDISLYFGLKRSTLLKEGCQSDDGSMIDHSNDSKELYEGCSNFLNSLDRSDSEETLVLKVNHLKQLQTQNIFPGFVWT